MKKKSIVIIALGIFFILWLVSTVYFLYELYWGFSGEREEEVSEYLNRYIWHAKTDQIDIIIYAEEGTVKYKYEEMEGVWGFVMPHGATMESMRIGFAEAHDEQEPIYEEENLDANGYIVEIISGRGRIKNGDLIIRFDDNDLLPQGAAELTFEREERDSKRKEISIEDTNEKLGNIGYKYITVGSEWKREDKDDEIYMKLKETNGQKIITYSVDGEERKVELIFPEGTESNQLTSFDLKIDINKELEETEDLPNQYIYDDEGKICGVIQEEFGSAFIYKDRMLLKFNENNLFPKDFREVVLKKQ